jgi:hypothetical protein
MIQTTAAVVETMRQTWRNTTPEYRVILECMAHIAKGGKSDIPYLTLYAYYDDVVYSLNGWGFLEDYAEYVQFIGEVAEHQHKQQVTVDAAPDYEYDWDAEVTYSDVYN